jgi:perosamine synthetase
MSRDVSRNVLFRGAVLREVMVRLNEGVGGAVIMVDEEGRLEGLFTDGDVRRALLAGATLDDLANVYMNRRPVCGDVARSRSENLALLSRDVRHVPVLDAERRPVELLSWTEIWRLGVASPALGGNELKYVCDCISSGWISSQGEYVSRFEETLAEHTGRHAVATSSGTTALHLGLLALGVGRGDEVIVPNLTFAASANAVVHAGATPVFVDICRDTWTLDPACVAAAITPATRGLMPVHLYGHPCDMDPLIDIARRHDLRVIEDCAESLGACYKGQLGGTHGDVACFSFFANKVITTGEGGMLVANDAAVAERARQLRDHGMSPERRYWHLEAGYNYRMTNLQAAVGVAQMERLHHFLDRRRALAARYHERLAGIKGLEQPPAAPWADPVCWLYSILVDPERCAMSRNELMTRLREHGVETRSVFAPLNTQPAFGSGDADQYPVCRLIADQGLSLPTSNHMRDEDVDHVCDVIAELVDDARLRRAAGFSMARRA